MSRLLRFIAWTLVIVGALIGLLRLTVIRWWRVPTGDPYLEASVAPTLRGGDWVILWRGTPPLEGDLVLCPEPRAQGRMVVARIVAEANDHVTVDRDTLFVNQRQFDTERGCDPFTTLEPKSGEAVVQGCRGETVGGKTHFRGEPRPNLPPPTQAESDVPSGQVFLVSDNRQFPWDSREFGTVPRDTCLEAIVYRLVSKDGFFDVANRLTLIR